MKRIQKVQGQPLGSGRGVANIWIPEYQYPEYRGPTVYVNLYNCRVLDFMIKSRMLSAVSNCCPLTFMTFFSKSILGFDFSINAIYNVFPLCPKHHLVASEGNVARIPYSETNPNMIPEINDASYESPDREILESGMKLGVASSWGWQTQLTEKALILLKFVWCLMTKILQVSNDFQLPLLKAFFFLM